MKRETLDAAEASILEQTKARDEALRADLAAWVAIPTGQVFK